MDYTVDLAVEMARVYREALARIREKMAAQQLGEAFREPARCSTPT